MPTNAPRTAVWTGKWTDDALSRSTCRPAASALVQPVHRIFGEAWPRLLRGLLLTGCVLAVAIAAWGAHPTGYLAEDAALSRLLHGMALLKGLAVAAAVAVILWRLRRGVTLPVAAGYLLSAWAMSAATVLIWQLVHIPLAAVLFHAALIGLLVTAWRDDDRA